MGSKSRVPAAHHLAATHGLNMRNRTFRRLAFLSLTFRRNMGASCRTYRLQNILISRRNVMQLGWSAGVPKKEPLRLGSSVVAGTQMMGNALLVRVSLRAIRSEPSFRLCSYVRRLAKKPFRTCVNRPVNLFDRNLLRPWVAANRICSEYFAKLWTVLHRN